MSNHLAIATVTATLRMLLQDALNEELAGAQVTTLQPHDSDGLPGLGANLYLYQVVPNVAWRNADLPTRTGRGELVQRPVIALDLYYLLTFYGEESDLEPQRAQGVVASVLHARPVLTQAMIQATLDAAALEDPNHYLLASDLGADVERVKMTPMPLDVDELSKLWSVLLQTPYTLSMVYVGTTVLIEADETPRRALPVRERVVGVAPFQHARIDAVVAATDDRDPIEMGDTIILRGAGLAGPIDRIRVDSVDTLSPGTVSSTAVHVALTDPGLRAGVVGAQIVYAGGATSNVAALVVRPRITQDGGGDYQISHNPGPETLDVVLTPEVAPEQRGELLLNEFRPATGPGRAYRIDAVERTAVTGTVTFPVGDVASGTYLVRVAVSGAETTLDVETDATSPNVGYYVTPAVTLP
jgi:hypothetical protein